VIVSPRCPPAGRVSHVDLRTSQSSANSNQIRVNVKTSWTFDGDAQEADFSLAVYINK
jgi:hypothetical protein